MSYTIKNLNDVEDSAAKHGYSEQQEARFPREDLDAERTGLAYIVLRPGKKQPFAHRHAFKQPLRRHVGFHAPQNVAGLRV